MATQKNTNVLTFQTATDLSAKQYYCVKLSANNTVALCAASTDVPIGVLQNKPSSKPAEVAVIGSKAKVIAGGTVAYGDSVGCDSAGKVVTYTATDTTKTVLGICLVGAASGELAEVLITTPGVQLS